MPQLAEPCGRRPRPRQAGFAGVPPTVPPSARTSLSRRHRPHDRHGTAKVLRAVVDKAARGSLISAFPVEGSPRLTRMKVIRRSPWTLVAVAVGVHDDDLAASRASAPPIPVIHRTLAQGLERNEPGGADRRGELRGYRGVGQIASALRLLGRYGARHDRVRLAGLDLAGTDS